MQLLKHVDPLSVACWVQQAACTEMVTATTTVQTGDVVSGLSARYAGC